jgi:autotransporter-associated beta strand protein
VGLGSGIFIQGGSNLTFAPPSGQTLTIANVIADPSGSGGSGVGGLILNGAGTTVLSATNTFSGGSLLEAGTLSLQASGAAGSGPIAFTYGSSDTLLVGPGDVPSNVIKGLLPGDIIDLQKIGTATSAKLGAGNILTIAGGTTPVQLALDPSQNFTGETFNVKSDSSGGTLLTATDVANDYPPSVSGTGTVAGDDHTPLNPLAGVTVSDLDAGQTETATLTLSSTLNGTLSNLGAGVYDAATGVYTVSGSAAALTAALDGLLFTPTIHQVAPGQVVTTKFSLSVSDGLMTSPATATTLNVTALNDAPVISGMPTGFVEGYWNVPLTPFPAVAITDPDVGATETVTLTVGGGTLSLSLPGITLTPAGVGSYTLTAGSPSAVTAALDALQFTPLPNLAVPGYTIGGIGLSVSDGIAPAVTAQVQVLAGLPIFSGIVQSQSTTGVIPISPFSTVSVTDSAGLTIQSLTITLYDSASNFATPTDANGVLSGANLTKVGVGTYTVTPGPTTAVSAELDALVFTPSSNTNVLTTDFVLSAFDGATTADSSAIAVTDSALCFCTGTRIATPGGEVPVEQIAAGDLVVTASGMARPVVWVGAGRVLATRGRRNEATPVIVRKGALGDNVPNRDLRVTKGHALYIDGVLIPVEFLVNHRSILWDDRAQEVELYHLELESHDVLLANGAPAESYRDDGNRWLFRNANTGWDLPPQEPCAQVLTGGLIVDEAWQWLLDRAGGPPRIPSTNEPDLHIVADGERIDGRRSDDGTYRFRLPRPATEVRVVSRAGAPCELGLARDPRVLGVALTRVMLWQGSRLRMIEASDDCLSDGYHQFEEANGFRWTDGDARLPPALLDGVTGVAELEVHVAATAQYPLFSEAVAA